MPPRLILASGSPQRQAILTRLGVDFEVAVSGAEELESGPPEEVALENAYRKARAVADRRAEAVADSRAQAHVLGVDTVVSLGPKLYGKPADRAEAEATLRALSARDHRVVSGLCLIGAEGTRTAAAVTTVRFRVLDDRLIAWYLDHEEWRERAGGYAIQGRGAALVAAVEGDYLNVVGLPVATLLELEPLLLAD